MLDIGYLENNDFDVVASTPKRINTEWRLIIVDGEVADYSICRQYQMVKPERSAPPEVLNFAKKIAKKFSPAAIFVMDIAKTDKGLKVVEYNTFNSANFYACNVGNIINAVNNFVLKT